MRVIAIGWCGFFIVAAALAGSTEVWVTLDPLGTKPETYLHREADRASITRQGPWALFTQRWVGVVNGRRSNDVLTEEMAVNCLTGAWSAYRYPLSAPKPGQPRFVETTLDEVERSQSDSTRLGKDSSRGPLYAEVFKLACDCSKKAAASPPTEARLHEIYDGYLVEHLRRRQFHVHFISVDSEELARSVIQELDAGVPFATLFNRYASAIVAAATPHGDLGFHDEAGWPVTSQRVLRSLKPGQYTRKLKDGVYGFEIIKLEAVRDIAAPAFEVLRPRILDYETRAARCGWPDVLNP